MIEHDIGAIRLAPQNGIWWMGLGISLQGDSRNGEARDVFRRALATNSLSKELANICSRQSGAMVRFRPSPAHPLA